MSGPARAQWARADFPGDPWDQAMKILIVEDEPKTGDYLSVGDRASHCLDPAVAVKRSGADADRC
jgi:hypothetical protein